MQQNACVSCRQRKLKCDKLQPCSNCAARSQECEQQVLSTTSRGIKRSWEVSDRSTIASILSRLDRLETQMNIQHDNNNAIATPIGDELNALRNSSHIPTSQVQTPAYTSLKPPDESMQRISLSTNDNSLSSALMHDLCVTVSSTAIFRQPRGPNQIQLPPKDEVLRSFHIYFHSGDPFQRIIFEPYCNPLIDQVYESIQNVSKTAAPKGLALILSVVAYSIVLEPVDGSLDEVLPILKQRSIICADYIRAAMDCLEQHRRRMNHTLEDVQALLVLSFLINHIETLSLRSRFLLTEAITVSHGLGLHQIDAKTPRRRSSREHDDVVGQEMKRRVWWYLISLDWLLSMIEGPSDTPYLIQPSLNATNIPKHLNNDDLHSNLVERPLSEPTSMSYVLHRLKAAEVGRCISDVAPHDPDQATYDTIVSLDSKIEFLLQDLPDFFRLEKADTIEAQNIEKTHPYIPVQRLLLNLMINLIRCKLHHPYLAGHANQSLHDFSRKSSLKAARVVLSAHKAMAAPNISHSADFMKVHGNAFLAFMGALIFAIDLCCNNPQGEDRERQLADLIEVLERLDRVKQYSQSAEEFLRQLTELLAKYKVWSPSIGSEISEENRTPMQPNVDVVGNGEMSEWDLPFPFEDLWESFVERPVPVDFLENF